MTVLDKPVEPAEPERAEGSGGAGSGAAGVLRPAAAPKRRGAPYLLTGGLMVALLVLVPSRAGSGPTPSPPGT